MGGKGDKTPSSVSVKRGGVSQTALILKAQRAAIKHDIEQKLQA